MAITKVTNSLVATNAIQGTLIADNAITSVHIAQNQVTSVQIPDSSITAYQLAGSSVGTGQLVNLGVTEAKIANNAVTSNKIATNSVVTETIAQNSITAVQIPDGSITDTQLGSGAFTMGTITTTGAIRGPASFTIDPAAVGDNTGTVVIAGNLQVDGTSTTINSTQLAVTDLNITVASGAGNASAANNAGLTIAGAGATMLYQSSGDEFRFNKPLYITSAYKTGTGATFVGQLTNSGGKLRLQSDSNRDIEIGDTNNASIISVDTSAQSTTFSGDLTIASGIFTTINDITTVNKFKTTNSNTRAAISMESKDSSGNAVDLRMHALGDGPRGEIFTFTNHPLAFATNNAAPQMTLLTNGNFGIGTGSNVDEILHLEKSSGTTLVKTQVAANSTVGFEIQKTGSTTSNWRIVDGQTVNGSLEIYDVTDSRQVIVFDGEGDIGMGVTPATHAKLTLGGTRVSYSSVLAFDNNTTGGATFFMLASDNTWSAGGNKFLMGHGSPSSAAVDVAIDADGKVGIGVTDPDTNLEVNIKGGADGNGIHITSTSTSNDPALKLSRNGGAADVFSLRPRGGAGSAYLSIAAGTSLDSGLIMSSAGKIGLGGNTAPISTLHMYGSNTADVASNGAGIAGLHLSRTSSKGENIYAYMTDGNAAASSWAGLGNVGKIESFGNNAFEIGTQQDAPVIIGQNNTQKIRIKGDITAHAKFGATYTESLYTPNGGTQSCRIFEDHLGKWVAVGYFAANAATSIQGTWSSVRGGPITDGQTGTTQFSADWGDSYPTEVRYLGASDFKNFNETKTIDFIHGVPVGRPWKNFFNNAQRRPDATTPHSGTTHMGSVEGAVGTEKYGWECRGAYDGRGRWHNPSYTHHKMSDINASTHLACPTAAFTTPTSNAFNWNTYSDAKISVHQSNDYSGQDTASYSAAFGRDDTLTAFFDDYPNSRNNMQSSTNNYGTAVYVLMKLPEMQSIGLQGGRSRDHQPGEVVQTKVYERNADVSATSGLTGELGSLDFTPLYGNSLLEFNIHANTGTNSAGSVFWSIYQGSSSAVGTLIRRTGNQIVAAYDQAADGHPLPFSWTQYYQLNDDKKSSYRYRVRFTPSGATYWGHTYGSTAHSYFTIKEIKQEHNATGITD